MAVEQATPAPAPGTQRSRLWTLSAVLITTTVVVLGFILVIGWFIPWQSELKSRGRSAIDEFHRRYHAGEYASIYSASHPTLQQDMARDDALLRLGEVRAKLGNVLDMGFGCQTFVQTGTVETLRVEYRVTFANGEAWETYDWRLEGETTRLLAYAVETGFEGGKPDWEVALAPRGIRPNDSTCTAEQDQLHWWER